MRWLAWGVTDTGRKREKNEDALLIADELGLFAVADGMGGHTGGAQASRMAVEVLEQEVRKALRSEDFQKGRQLGPSADDPPGQALEAAAKAAGQAIHRAAAEDESLAGMGTTLTALLLHGDRAYTIHVGDSRAYLLRDNQLLQLTVDHTWIEEQIRAGFMTRIEAEQSELKHIVTRSVGYEPQVRVDLLAMPALMGDCFLLCSDGLSNHLDDDGIRGHLNSHYYSKAPERLVHAANELGGDDNVTALVVYIANDTPRPEI